MAVTLAKVSTTHAHPENSLGAVWRKLLKDRNVTELELNSRITSYINRGAPDLAEHQRQISFDNLQKELTQVDMSWKIFCKGLKVLGIDEITMLV